MMVEENEDDEDEEWRDDPDNPEESEPQRLIFACSLLKLFFRFVELKVDSMKLFRKRK